MKRFLSAVLAGMMALSLMAGCSSGGDETTNEPADTGDTTTTESTSEGLFPAVPKEELKVGVIHITDPAEGTGYTYTHDLGIQGMQKELGLDDSQIIRKNNVSDTDATAIRTALEECVEEGCQVIFATSWGYMDYVEEIAEEYPDVLFAHGTGNKSNGSNFINYFGKINQARYLSGIAAGMKTESTRSVMLPHRTMKRRGYLGYRRIRYGR